MSESQGQDFTVDKFINGRATVIDYYLSLDMAKELLWSGEPVPASAHGGQSDFASTPSKAVGAPSMVRGQSSDLV